MNGRRGAVLGVLLSGLLLALGTGVGPFGALAWLALVPILRVVYRAASASAADGGRVSLKAAVAAGFAAFLLGQSPFLWAYQGALPLVPLVANLALLAAVFALVSAASAVLLRRLPPALGVLAFPLLWTGWELLLARWGPHGSAGSLAYSQAEILPIAQLASVAGLSGITFLLAWVSSVLAWCSLPSRELHGGLRWVAAPCALALIAVIAFGSWRLAGAAPGTVVRVGLAATDRTVASFATEDARVALATVSDYGRRVRALGARGAEWIVLPEKLVAIRPAWKGEAERDLAQAAAAARTHVVAGFNEWGSRGERTNEALWLSPEGAFAGRYRKRHLVPGLEAAYEPGFGRLISPQGVALAICKDMDFPDLGRDLAAHGARLVLVPAWDFVRDGRPHARMALLRGVESGFAVARSAQQGLLTASDAYGRILAEAPSALRGETLLVADLPLGPGPTFYARHGDLFGFACLLAAALSLLGLAWNALRARARPSPA